MSETTIKEMLSVNFYLQHENGWQGKAGICHSTFKNNMFLSNVFQMMMRNTKLNKKMHTQRSLMATPFQNEKKKLFLKSVSL
jgi:hypothetical protein